VARRPGRRAGFQRAREGAIAWCRVGLAAVACADGVPGKAVPGAKVY
jgi:hypothetical protein